MIKINLLPYRDVQKKERVWQQIITMVACVVAGILIIGIAHWQILSLESSFEKNKVDLESQIKELDKKLGQLDKIKAQKGEIERKLQVIEKLNTQRLDVAKLLNTLAMSVPENVWLTSLSYKGAELIIDGEAMTGNDVSDFMKRLEDQKIFNKVILTGMDQTVRGETKIVKFNLKLTKVESGTKS